jgi:hypothetical protein
MVIAVVVAVIPLILEVFKVRMPLWLIVLIEIVALLAIGSAFFYKQTISETTIETETKIDTNEKQGKETEAAKPKG